MACAVDDVRCFEREGLAHTALAAALRAHATGEDVDRLLERTGDALALDPLAPGLTVGDPDLWHVVLAREAMLRGDLSGARSELDRLSWTSPRWAESRLLLARVEQRQGDVRGALNEAVDVLDATRDPAAARVVSELYADADPWTATAFARQAVTADPGSLAWLARVQARRNAEAGGRSPVEDALSTMVAVDGVPSWSADVFVPERGLWRAELLGQRCWTDEAEDERSRETSSLGSLRAALAALTGEQVLDGVVDGTLDAVAPGLVGELRRDPDVGPLARSLAGLRAEAAIAPAPLDGDLRAIEGRLEELGAPVAARARDAELARVDAALAILADDEAFAPPPPDPRRLAGALAGGSRHGRKPRVEPFRGEVWVDELTAYRVVLADRCDGDVPGGPQLTAVLRAW